MMNRTLNPLVLVALAGWMLLTSLPLWAQAQERPSWNHLANRSLEMRYFIYVESKNLWDNSQKRAVESNQKSMKEDPDQDFFESLGNFYWEQFFEAQTVLRIPHWELAKKPEKIKYPEDLAVVVIEFDKDGWVTTPNSYNKPLRVRLDSMSPTQWVELSPGDALNDPVSSLGKWFRGLNKDTADGVTPALCTSYSMPYFPEDLLYVYGPYYKIKKKSWRGIPPFACREWAWQMHTAERPYIDVTNYVPKEPQYGYPHGTYILPFIGWGTFDRAKPVIGKHANTWYCLHECPNGDKPGPIADIKTWAKANGWASPKPPTRMPVFTDNPKRRGSYLP